MKSEWRLTGLLRPDNTPRPSYLAFKTAADFLTLARYRGPVAGYPAGIFGHSYWPQVGTPIDVIWSTDGAPRSVPLPSGAAAFDRYGTPAPGIRRQDYCRLRAGVHSKTSGYGQTHVFDDRLAPRVAFSFPFLVRQGASSISKYDLQVRMGLDGQWTDLLPDTILTSTNYALVPGSAYYFRVRAKDIDGNIEDWPVQYNTSTSVDFTKPASSMTALPANSSTSSLVGSVLSGVAGYDLQVRVGNDGQWTDLLTDTPAINTTYPVFPIYRIISVSGPGMGQEMSRIGLLLRYVYGD